MKLDGERKLKRIARLCWYYFLENFSHELYTEANLKEIASLINYWPAGLTKLVVLFEMV